MRCLCALLVMTTVAQYVSTGTILIFCAVTRALSNCRSMTLTLWSSAVIGYETWNATKAPYCTGTLRTVCCILFTVCTVYWTHFYLRRSVRTVQTVFRATSAQNFAHAAVRKRKSSRHRRCDRRVGYTLSRRGQWNHCRTQYMFYESTTNKNPLNLFPERVCVSHNP